MKLLIVFAGLTFTVFMCQVSKGAAQRSIYERDGQQFGVERYRRQKKSQRPPSRAQYYSTPNLIDPAADPYPNSFYNRMPTNKSPDGVNSKRISIDPNESGKVFHHLHGHHSHHSHLKRRRRPHQYAAQTSPCYYRNARSTRNGAQNTLQEGQGRFFWDLNLYNIIPGVQAQVSDDCGDNYGGGSYLNNNGGSLSPFSNGGQFLNNYLLNLAGYSYRPQNRPPRPLSTGLIPNNIPGISNIGSGSGSSNGGSTDNQNPDIYDPVYDERPVYENQYAAQAQVSQGPSLSPGQIVGGIAQTVNGVIQTLSGNTQQGTFLRTLYNRNLRNRRYRY